MDKSTTQSQTGEHLTPIEAQTNREAGSKRRAVMVMFDTMCRDMLPPYGNTQVIAPNFTRLAQKTVTFENAFVGSLPCMPARREIHTGRYNFLHRAWGPLEPFDESMPSILTNNGVYTHLTSDHYHYWETGGATYHCQYNTWECFRGQEGDQWYGEVNVPDMPNMLGRHKKFGSGIVRQDAINRKYIKQEEDFPMAQSFSAGLRFIETNKDADNWFLQLETFDPHEPFFTPEQYRAMYPSQYDGAEFEWPAYGTAEGYSEQEIARLRRNYFALVTMCDKYLGQVLDIFDKHNLWEDTMLIVNTDHGFLLGEHNYLGKSIMPLYNEIARIPLFIYDPRVGIQGERRTSLVQTIDLAPTLLDYFGVKAPNTMLGNRLADTIKSDAPVHNAGLFGCMGEYLNVTDGRYVYMRAPRDNKMEQYTLMPSRMRTMFDIDTLSTWRQHPGFSFTKGVAVMQIFSRSNSLAVGREDLLFDMQNDEGQTTPIKNKQVEARMLNYLKDLLIQNEAPENIYSVYNIY